MTLSKTFKIPKHFGNLCLPSKIYAILAIISCVIYVVSMLDADTNLKIYDDSDSVHGYTVVGFVTQVAFSVLWVILLNYICKTFKHGSTISWVILLLPLFFFLFALLLMLFVVSQTCTINLNLRKKQTSFETKQHSYDQQHLKLLNQRSDTEDTQEVMEYGYDIQGHTL